MDATRSEPIYENDGGETDELERAIRVCLMGGDIHLPLTCIGKDSNPSAEQSLDCVWDNWCQTLFVGVLAPHLIDVFSAAHGGDVKAIILHDRALSEKLIGDVAERSAVAGCQFHASMEGARHVKLLDKLQRAVLEEEIAGHHATFFACEAAIFNIPMMHLLPAFLFAEWRTARTISGIPGSQSCLASFQAQCPQALTEARQVFSRIAGGGNLLSVCA